MCSEKNNILYLIDDISHINNKNTCLIYEDILESTINYSEYYHIFSFNKNEYVNKLIQSKSILTHESYNNYIKNKNNIDKIKNYDYNLINHIKILLLKNIKELYPNYKYYQWNHNIIPVDKTDKIYITYNGHKIDEFINEDKLIYINLIPYELIDWFVDKYLDKLYTYPYINMVDDQAIIFDIYKRFEDKFIVIHDKIKIGFNCKKFENYEDNEIIYNYAFYIKYNYNIDCIILYENNLLDKFKNEFICYNYNIDNISKLITNEKITYLYTIINNENDVNLTNSCKNIFYLTSFLNIDFKNNLCMVNSKELLEYYNNYNFNIVPPLITIPKINDNYREILSIPKDAIVIGRYGNYHDFNIQETYEAIKHIVDNYDNYYFIFANTNPFYIHPKILYLRSLDNNTEKALFINTCNVMIHGNINGETFGLSIAEFNSLNKPIITCTVPSYNCHIKILNDKGLYYYNKESLINILKNIPEIIKLDYNWIAYNYDNKDIMNKFINCL